MSKVHVYDTYATSQSGRILHFDVVLPEQNGGRALACARQWLASVGEEDPVLTEERCCYCHSEDAAVLPAELQREITERGYTIYKMEGCPS